MDLPTWTTNAINRSSMALNPDAVHGHGYRRDYTKDAKVPTWEQRPNVLINDNNQGVYISNPFYMIYRTSGPPGNTTANVNISGIGEPASNGQSGKERPAQDPDFPVEYPDKLKFTSVKDAQKVNAVLRSGNADYVLWGYLRMSRASLKTTAGVTDFYGFCDEFTCLSIAILSQPTFYMDGVNKHDNPIASGTLIEAVSCLVTATSGARLKHIFCLVNRDQNSDIKIPSTWGASCFAVDQWYGLQIYQCPLPGTPVGDVQTVFRVSNINQQPEAAYFGAISGAGISALKLEAEFSALKVDIKNPGGNNGRNVSR